MWRLQFPCALTLSLVVVGCASTSPRLPDDTASKAKPSTQSRAIFFPPALDDDWTQWIIGVWEGAGTGQAGTGHGSAQFELALSGQFLICRGQSVITALDPDYLKKHMRATDAEIDRFKRAGYQMLEIYTIDQKTGEVIGFLFDNLRCVATARGKREGETETMNWEWQSGHKSTRITQKTGLDKMKVTERTSLPSGSVMEDSAEMTRAKK